MPVIPKKGEYPKRVIPSKSEIEHIDGRVNLGFIPYLAEGIEAVKNLNPWRKKKGGEPTAPPKPPGAGTYHSRHEIYENGTLPYAVVERAYRDAMMDIMMEGDVSIRNGREMREHRGSTGYEEGDGMTYQRFEFADDVPIGIALHQTCHELSAARRFKGRPRYKGDHQKHEEEIQRNTDDLTAKYLADALRENVKMRRN